MNIYKTSFLSLLSTFIKTISLFIINKFVAVVGGPVALTQLGSFQNFSAIIQVLSGTMYQTGITKFVSELKTDLEREAFYNKFLFISISQSVFITLLLLLFSNLLSEVIFSSDEFIILIYLLLFALPFMVYSILSASFFNGIGRINEFILINILASVINLLLVLVFGYFWGVIGIYSAFAIYYIFVSLFVYRMIKRIFYSIVPLKLEYDSILIKKLLFFSMITVSSILISNITLIIIRTVLNSSMLPSNYSGYWQGVWNLSQVAMSFITLSLSTYLLPTLSKMDSFEKITLEIYKSAKLILPFSVLISIAIYLLRYQIIMVLYTDEFIPMADMFLWQFLGNIIKSVSWLYGFVLVSKGMVKVTIITEVIVSAFLISLCSLFVHFGIESAPTLAYFFTAILHLVLMISLYYTVVKNELSKSVNSDSCI